MNKKISFLVALGLISFKLGQAQQQVHEESNLFSESFQSSVIDQFEKEKELAVLHLDSVENLAGNSTVFDQEDVNITQRIQRLQQVIPLEYNARVKAYLDKYLSSNYKPYMEKLLGLSQYYFPIYDQIFDEQGIPQEVKYMSVIESSLNPNTVSTSGAVGLWQFMYATAKGYDLTINANMDERKDVYSTTYAVSKYLKDAHAEFNDWLLALASYNCGRGCVRRAIKRSGLNQPNYWELAPFLPKETQNYIPKFIAMTYVLNHADLYELTPSHSGLYTEHKVLMINKSVSLDHLADVLSFSPDLLKDLNPAYKNTIVSASADNPHRLVIPFHEELSDSLIYAALNNQTPEIQNRNPVISKSDTEKEVLVSKLNKRATKEVTPRYVSYIVRKGDTLSEIASKHKGASVSRLKTDNNLRGSRLKIGQKLKVFKGKG